MKMKPLLGIRPTWLDSSPAEQARAPAAPPTLYAAVEARDASGAPSRLALPGPLAAGRCGLYVNGTWAGDVESDGAIKGDKDRADLLAAIVPGTNIVAATDRAGRVLALSTVGVRLPRPSMPRRRAAEPSPVHSRSRDPYGHDANEVLISGCVGRVLKVS
jgi:hypothetical protein